MHSCYWSDLRKRLESGIQKNLSVLRQFSPLRARCPSIIQDSPANLIDFFIDTTQNLDLKDRIYGELLPVIQERGPLSDLASTLLWLGLWPGLTNRLGLLCEEYHRSADDTAADVATEFLSKVHRADPGNIRRVAATLVKSTWSKVQERYQKDRAEANLTERLFREVQNRKDGSADLDDSIEIDPRCEKLKSPVSRLPSGMSVAARLREVQSWLVPVLGQGDFDLLFAVQGEGQSLMEVAKDCGLAYETVRKRFQRVRDKADEHLKRLGVHLP